MNKTELFHLHSLLAAVAGDFDDRGTLTDDDLDAYRDVGTSQFDVQAKRDDHEEAVLALSRGVAGAAERAADETDRPADQPTLLAD